MKSVVGLLGICLIPVYSMCLAAAEVCKITDPETGISSFTECESAGSGAVEVNVTPLNTVKSTDITRGKGFIPSHLVRKPSSTDRKNRMQKKEESAKQLLEEAKIIKPGDRVNTVNGSRLSEAYFERVKEAEEHYNKSVAQ